MAWGRARGACEASGALPVASPRTAGCRPRPGEAASWRPLSGSSTGRGDLRIPGFQCQWEAPRAPHCFLALTMTDRKLQGSALPVPEAPLVPGLLQMLL